MNWTGCSLSSTREFRQRDCSAHGRSPQIRSCDTASDGLTLAAGTTTYPVQAVCADVRVPKRNSTRILVRLVRSASTSDLVIPPTRRASIGDRAFAVAGPRAWNSLPPALRLTSKSFSSFKKTLNRLFLDFHFACDNVYIDCVKRSSNSSYGIIALNNLS